MEDIMGHFGDAFLYMLAGATMLAVAASFFLNGGIINNAVAAFMQSICG